MVRKIFKYASAVILAVVAALAVTSMFQLCTVSGISMEPTVSPKDIILIDRLAYIKNVPEPGDIIIFRSNLHYPGGENKKLIKRIVGTSGDTIKIQDNKVYRNGELVDEAYTKDQIYGDMAALRVQKDHLFVLGDNRAISIDSRNAGVGQVSINEVMGKVRFRVFPFNEVGYI